MGLLLLFTPATVEADAATSVWDGAEFATGVLNVWDGADWVPGVLKVWDGAAWQPGGAPAIADDFADLDDVVEALGGFTSTGGRLRTDATTTFSVATHLGAADYDDQYSEIEVVTFGSGAQVGAAVRLDGAAGTGYVVHYVGGTDIRMLEIRTGWSVWTVHTFTTVGLPTAPFTLRAELVGTTLEAFVDGASIGTVDVSTVIGDPLLTSGTPGVAMWNSDAVANTEIESWEAGPA